MFKLQIEKFLSAVRVLWIALYQQPGGGRQSAPPMGKAKKKIKERSPPHTTYYYTHSQGMQIYGNEKLKLALDT